MGYSNIEKFDDIAGRAFARLYQSFPVPVALQAQDFVNADNIFDKKVESAITPDAEFCMACLNWLVDAGYITTGKVSYLHLESVVLTAKGLEALKAVPASLETPTPLGERMVQAAKTEGRHALRALVGQALGVGLQLMGRSVGPY